MNTDKIFANNAALMDLVGRLLLVSFFVLSGFGKVGNYAGTQGYMESHGVPGLLLPLVIGLEVLGGLAIAVGWNTRTFAFLLAGFSLLTAVVFHGNFDEGKEYYSFMKNLVIAGGFLVLAAHGAGGWSLAARRKM